MLQNDTFASFANEYKPLLEEQLSQWIKKLKAPSVLKEAMDYSLQAGGKRIRPMLLLATLKAFGKDPQVGMHPAVALEMVHTYSLIHDDLPSMDNDDFRRGKLTNHKVFGDAVAILAGDALLTYCFQIIAETPSIYASDSKKVALILEMAKAAGAEGMVGGQTADIQGEGKELALEDVNYIHLHKTGKLLQLGVVAGAILADATEEQLHYLKEFSYHVGIAFQIRDDILDIEGDEAHIGKPIGSDVGKGKNTYPTILTMNGAKAALEKHLQDAQRALTLTGLQTGLLAAITDLIVERNH